MPFQAFFCDEISGFFGEDSHSEKELKNSEIDKKPVLHVAYLQRKHSRKTIASANSKSISE